MALIEFGKNWFRFEESWNCFDYGFSIINGSFKEKKIITVLRLFYV
jgi:hypothetical protein